MKNTRSYAQKLKHDDHVPPEYRLLAAVILQAERDAERGDKLAVQWLADIRKTVDGPAR